MLVVIDLVMLSVGIYLIHSTIAERSTAVAAAPLADAAPQRQARAPRTLAPVAVQAQTSRPEAEPATAAQATPVARVAQRNPAPRGESRVADAPPPASEKAPEPAPESAPAPEEAPPTAGDSPTPEEDSPPADSDSPAPDPEASGARVASDADVEALARQVALIVDNNREALTRCYERAAKGPGVAEPLSGRVEVRLTVLPGGFAANVRPVSNDTGSDVLAGCLVSLVRSWQFPTHDYDPVDFVWPFVFHPPQP